MSIAGSEISRTSSTAPVIRPHPSPANAIGRTGLFIILGISLVAAVARVSLDFAGPLFGLAIVDLFHILFLLVALYGTWKYKPRFLGFFVTWLIFWFVWNILVIFAFQGIGFDPTQEADKVNSFIDLGAQSTSFWSRSGPGCRQKTHDEMPSSHNEGEPYPYVDCSMSGNDAETVVAAVHVILAIIGFIMGMYEIYVFTEELDVLQRPKCESQEVYSISVGATPPGSASNVKILEVDYLNGGRKFDGNHVFLPRFFYTCFCDGRSRLPGHWPPSDIERVSGSGGAQMWETGREGEKEVRKDFVDPMSRGRPNNYSARARSKSPSSSSTSSTGSQRKISKNPNFSRDDTRRRSSQRSSRSKSRKTNNQSNGANSNGHLNNSIASNGSTISKASNERSKSPGSVQSTEDGKSEKPALWKRMIGLEEVPKKPVRSSSRNSSSRSPKRARNSTASTSTTLTNGSTARSSSRSPARNSTRGASKSPQVSVKSEAKSTHLAPPSSRASSTSSSSPQRSPNRQLPSAAKEAATAAAAEKDKQKKAAELAATTKANSKSTASPKSPRASKSSTSSSANSASSKIPQSPKSSKPSNPSTSSSTSSSKTASSSQDNKTKVKEQPQPQQQKQQKPPQQQKVQQQAPKEPSVEVTFDKDASKGSSSTAPKVGKISYVSSGKISFDPEGPKKNGEPMVPLQDGTLDSTFTGDSSASCNGDDTGSESGGLRVRFNENPDVHHMSPRKSGTLKNLKNKLRMSSDGGDEANKKGAVETKGKRSSGNPQLDSGFGSEHDSPQLQRMPRKSSLKKRNRNTSQASSDRSSGVSENDIRLDPSGAESGASNPAFQGDDLSAQNQRLYSDTSSDEFNTSISLAPDGGSGGSGGPRSNSAKNAAIATNATASSPHSRAATESPSPRSDETPRSGSPDHGYHADAEAERNGKNSKKSNPSSPQHKNNSSSPHKNNSPSAFVNVAFDNGEDDAASKTTSGGKNSKGGGGAKSSATANDDRFSKPLTIETSPSSPSSLPNQTLDSGLVSASLGSIGSNPSSTALLDSGASSPASSTGGAAATGVVAVVANGGFARKGSGRKKKPKSSAAGAGSANSIASAVSNASSNGSSTASKGKSAAAAATAVATPGSKRKCAATGGLCTIYCTPLRCSAGPVSDNKKKAVS